jgi:hypothetical protein
VAGVLLIFIASNKNARYLISKMNLSWHLSNTEAKEAHESMIMGFALAVGMFILGIAFVGSQRTSLVPSHRFCPIFSPVPFPLYSQLQLLVAFAHSIRMSDNQGTLPLSS